MVSAAECAQARDDQCGVVERGLVVSLQPALQPPRRNA
jgi:hypothetical protein